MKFETRSPIRRKTMKAWERAAACFLHSEVLPPLEKLSNVQSIRIRFACGQADGQICELESNHHSVLADLKQKFERNHAVRKAL